MGKSLDALKIAIEEVVPLSSEAWQAFAAIWHPITIANKQVISPSCSTDPYFYCNQKGILRLVHHSDDGTETTIEFILQGNFSGYLDTEHRQKKAPFELQALTKTKLLRCLYTDLDALAIQYPEIERFIRMSLCRRMETLIQHLVTVQCCSSQEKCDRVLADAPELMQLVPQKYIANHLGIHATNFSKYKRPKPCDSN